MNFMEQFIHCRDRKTIGDGGLVKNSIVDPKVPSSILSFLDKNNGGRKWTSARANESLGLPCPRSLIRWWIFGGGGSGKV